jgi:integration host factor subunit beta
VTKSELIAALAARYPQLAARDTDYAVKTVLDAMAQALATGQRIEIRGFGSFSLSRRSPRVGRNPKSGEQVLVPGKQVPHFKAGKELRERVDLDGNDDGSAQASGDGVEIAVSGVGAHAML